MPRGVGTAQITIPGSVSRLKKHGYCAVVLAADVWKMTATSASPETSDPKSKLPVVYLSRIAEDIS